MSVLYCRVPWLCCVDARGADAYDFLRRQLSNDPPADDDRVTFAAWNDARGRVRALFRIVRGANGPLLIAECDGIDAVLEKLRIFVLRSDVVLERNDALEIAAVIGDAAEVLGAHGIALGPDSGAARRGEGLLWIRQSDDLVYVVGSAADLERLGARLEPVDPAYAARAEIRAGLPYVGSALAERYVPQMLNLDQLGAIAFDKGCYPGQEVVARLRYRGSVKRRLARFVAPAATEAPSPGTPLVDASGNETGDVVRAVAVDGRLELLAVVPLDAHEAPLFLGSATNVRLEAAA